MSIYFSLFDGSRTKELKEPFDYWNIFLNGLFELNKNQTINCHIHYCIPLKKDELAKDEYISNFFQRLPFDTFDEQQNSFHFWLHSPELVILLNEEMTESEANNVALILLDTFLHLLSKEILQEKFKLLDSNDLIEKIKTEIEQEGILQILAKTKNQYVSNFKNKYWI